MARLAGADRCYSRSCVGTSCPSSLGSACIASHPAIDHAKQAAHLCALQYDDAQSRGPQLPTSKAGPSGRPGPPAPQPSYSGAPQYHQPPQAYGPSSGPAYPSGQHPPQQRSGPPSNPQGGYPGYAPAGPSGPPSGSMGGFNPYGPPPGGAYGQPPGGQSMASMLNPWSMISSVSQMGACAHRTICCAGSL